MCIAIGGYQPPTYWMENAMEGGEQPRFTCSLYKSRIDRFYG